MSFSATDERLSPRQDLSAPRPLSVCFPILLSGDLVLSPEHLGPAYLASILRQAGAEVTIIEVPLDQDESRIFRSVHAARPRILGISLMTVALAQAKRIGHLFRQSLGENVFIVAGGPIPTHIGARLLDLPGWEFLDALVRGEGEVPMLRLAEAIHTGQSLSSVPSLCWREHGEIRTTPMQAGIHDLNQLFRPSRDQLEQHQGGLPYVRLSTSRGCTARCTFCNAPHSGNRVGPPIKAWRGNSPKYIVDEIEGLVRRYGVNTFDFVDSTFEDPGGGAQGKARVRAIADEILARGLKIYFNVCMQAANWRETDRPLIEHLYRAGLEKVLVGVESGSDAGLTLWRKRASVDDNRRTIRLLRDAGVYVAFGFILFHPWSTFQDVRENQVFLRDYFGHNLRRFTTRLEVYPGAEVVSMLADEGLLKKEFYETLDPLAYSFTDPRIADLARCLNAIYGDEYEKTGIIIEEPAVMHFETYDIVVHNFWSRLKRAFGGDNQANEILTEFLADVEAIRSEMKTYNFNLMSELTDLAEVDRLTEYRTRDVAGMTEDFYQHRMREIEQRKLQTGLRLKRLGYDIERIDRAEPTSVAVG